MSAPMRRYLGPRLAAIEGRLDSLAEQVSALRADPLELERAMRSRWLQRVDVTDHNRGGHQPAFADFDSHAVSAAQCVDPAYLEWYRRLLPGWFEDCVARTDGGDAWERRGGVFGAPAPLFNRKAWEWAYIAEMASQAVGSRRSGRALGFGVGNEPLPALFASWGMDVVATDQSTESGADWAETGELMGGLEGLSRPHLLSPEEFARRVAIRTVDMNALPDDLGAFDLIWSSCSIEHLGSPALGLRFVAQSCRLLRPGGVAVHTTELELTRRETTADHGHCAVYRIEDLQEFAGRMLHDGYRISLNTAVCMDTPQDRWIDLGQAEAKLADLAHLRVVIGDSVTTSFGLLVRKPV
ncbi:MAG: class I SAM-dependent methyltransferase [Candidatus Dormibacteria bacterium]